MAATRNKFMYSEFCVDYQQVVRQKQLVFDTNFCMNDRPALPIGYNAPKMPASLLANNSVDIESTLYGIGANNYIFPKQKVTPNTNQLPVVKFYEPLALHIPTFPPPLTNQRPTSF